MKDFDGSLVWRVAVPSFHPVSQIARLSQTEAIKPLSLGNTAGAAYGFKTSLRRTETRKSNKNELGTDALVDAINAGFLLAFFWWRPADETYLHKGGWKLIVQGKKR